MAKAIFNHSEPSKVANSQRSIYCIVGEIDHCQDSLRVLDGMAGESIMEWEKSWSTGETEQMVERAIFLASVNHARIKELGELVAELYKNTCMQAP